MRWIGVVGALLWAGVAASGQYANPVLNTNFPDPAVIRDADGMFWAYATQGKYKGRMLNLPVARSRDLVGWTVLGDALPKRPSWASKTQDFWAPHVIRRGRQWLMYYSAKPDAAQNDKAQGLCLGVAAAERPEGPFTDKGKPLLCGAGFVNIDPFAYAVPGTERLLLYWGSGFEPIRVQELAADGMNFAPGSRPIDLVPPIRTDDPTNYRRLVEGAWVVKRAGWFYLFFSGDNCCGPRAHYALMVARSRSATGPFAVRADASAPGGVILASSKRWIAPGHNALATDMAGQDWLLYHAIDARHPRESATDDLNTRRVMLLDRIEWRDGWPNIIGRAPGDGNRQAPVFSRR